MSFNLSDSLDTVVSAGNVAASLPSFRNAIINGDMRVAQRGTSFAPLVNIYGLDRWRNVTGTTAARSTATQDSDTPGDQFGYSMKLDCTIADASVDTNDLSVLTQYIEGYNFKRFVGETATLSFWIKSSKTGTMGVSFVNSGSDRSYVAEVTINSSSVWEKKTITLDFDYSGGTWDFTNGIGVKIYFTLICGSNWHATAANTWESGNKVTTANQTNFLDSTDNNMWITGVQLELGSKATDFEFMDYEQQIAMCQRYYEVFSGAGALSGLYSDWYASSTQDRSVTYLFYKVAKRTSPTASLLSGSFTTLNCSMSYNSEALTGSPSGAGRTYYYLGSASDIFQLDAEL